MDITAETLQQIPSLCPACKMPVRHDRWQSTSEVSCSYCTRLLWFVEKEVGDIIVVTFLPGLLVGSEALERVDELLVTLGSSRRLLLDLSELRLITSMFLGMLVPLNRRMAADRKTLKLCGLRPAGRDAFKVTRFDRLFEIHADVVTAIQSFS
jgi:anti-sigma B factor antagonist